jgi:putative ABC transport system permease protein
MKKYTFTERLIHYLFPDTHEAKLGDFVECHNRIIRENGRFKAFIWFLGFLVRSLPSVVKLYLFWTVTMLKSYLKTAFRNIKRQKAYSFINIAGLSMGLTCCIFIYMYVQHETSYDSYHEDSDQLYRVTVALTYPTGLRHFAGVSPMLTPYARENFPQVEYAARIWTNEVDQQVAYGDKIFKEDRRNIITIEKDILNILSIPLKQGDPENALTRPFTAVISNRAAQKYFGDEDPLGKILTVGNSDIEITGVTEELPGNTFFKFTMLISWSSLPDEEVNSPWYNTWFGAYPITFIKLASGVDPNEFAELCSGTVYDNAKEILDGRNAEYKCVLQPVTEIHLHSDYIWDIFPHSNVIYIYIFSGIGLFIFFIACINFINLSTARSSKRACEVGMRKVAGAQKGQLLVQFIGESMLITLISFTIAITAVLLLMPKFNELAVLEIGYSDLLQPGFIYGMLIIIFFVGLTAGGYPALFLSSFKPVSVLRGSIRTGLKGGKLRKALVIGQFTLSIAMISSVLVFNGQIDYMKNQPLGFDKEQKLIINVDGNGIGRNNYRSIKAEFSAFPSVNGVCFSSSIPGRGSVYNYRVYPEGEKETNAHLLSCIFVDEDYLSVYGIRITAGENLIEAARSSAETYIWTINETAVNAFGWSSPDEALNVRLTEQEPVRLIKGVFKDHHFAGLQNSIEPQAIIMGQFGGSFMTINTDTENIRDTVSLIEQKYKTLFPGRVFEYFFLDDDFNMQYTREEQTSKIFGIFTSMGIFIACLGLYGLAAFMAEQRTKEIGIRKVMGASVSGILNLLSREFLFMVIVANVIAWPLSYYVMNRWLQNFAYRIDIGVVPFVLAGIIAILIALISVSFHSLKAAKANPVDSLRYE